MMLIGKASNSTGIQTRSPDFEKKMGFILTCCHDQIINFYLPVPYFFIMFFTTLKQTETAVFS